MQRFRIQAKILCNSRGVQPSELPQLFSMVVIGLVVRLIQMTVLDQDTGNIQFHSLPDNPIVVCPFVVESGLDPSGIQSFLCQKLHLRTGEAISFAVIFPKGRHPALCAEKRMVFRHIKVKAEQKIRVHLRRILCTLFQGQLRITLSCQIHFNPLVLFQFFLHRLRDDHGHFLFGVIFILRAEVFPAVSRIDDHTHRPFLLRICRHCRSKSQPAYAQQKKQLSIFCHSSLFLLVTILYRRSWYLYQWYKYHRKSRLPRNRLVYPHSFNHCILRNLHQIQLVRFLFTLCLLEHLLDLDRMQLGAVCPHRLIIAVDRIVEALIMRRRR